MLPRVAELERLMPEKEAADTSKLLLCPMPGLVVSIAVLEGQDVKAGETLAVVEAMKMENVLRADRDLTVGRILARPGDTLAVDAPIMEFASYVDDNPTATMLAQSLKEAGGKDHILISAKSIARGVNYRLQIEEGVIQAVGKALQMAGAGPGQ